MPRTPHKVSSKPKKQQPAPGKVKSKKKSVPQPKALPPAVQKLIDQPLTKKHLVTRTALRRAACRAGIRCMAKECLDQLVNMFDKKANDCLLQAKNNACYVRKARTLASTDIVAGSRECGMGDVLVC